MRIYLKTRQVSGEKLPERWSFFLVEVKTNTLPPLFCMRVSQSHKISITCPSLGVGAPWGWRRVCWQRAALSPARWWHCTSSPSDSDSRRPSTQRVTWPERSHVITCALIERPPLADFFFWGGILSHLFRHQTAGKESRSKHRVCVFFLKCVY